MFIFWGWKYNTRKCAHVHSHTSIHSYTLTSMQTRAHTHTNTVKSWQPARFEGALVHAKAGWVSETQSRTSCRSSSPGWRARQERLLNQKWWMTDLLSFPPSLWPYIPPWLHSSIFIHVFIIALSYSFSLLLQTQGSPSSEGCLLWFCGILDHVCCPQWCCGSRGAGERNTGYWLSCMRFGRVRTGEKCENEKWGDEGRGAARRWGEVFWGSIGFLQSFYSDGITPVNSQTIMKKLAPSAAVQALGTVARRPDTGIRTYWFLSAIPQFNWTRIHFYGGISNPRERTAGKVDLFMQNEIVLITENG